MLSPTRPLTGVLRNATLLCKGTMQIDPTKLTALRKGLLEFLILGVVSADTVYAADILKRLSATDFATQEGTLYPLLSKMRGRDSSTTTGRSPGGSAAQVLRLTPSGQAQLREFREYWGSLTTLIDDPWEVGTCTASP